MAHARFAKVAVVILGFAIFAACSGGAEPTTSEAPSTSRAGTEHVATATGDLFLPSDRSTAPLLVLVPGGAWRTADPTGLVDLAAALADAGMVTMTTTVRAAEDGVAYPAPIEDVLCAVATAAEAATAHGVDIGPVVLFGHSTGAHLAALAALSPERYDPLCSADPPPVDALIGVSGTYDVDAMPEIAIDLFGVAPTEAPELWQEGNAVLAASLRPDLPVLLVHGEADQLVPMAFTKGFADALSRGGHAVTVVTVPGADHHTIYRPETVADAITAWVGDLG